MRDKNQMVDLLADLLGPECDRALAGRVYERLRADDRIYYADASGLTLAEGVDLLAVAEEELSQ